MGHVFILSETVGAEHAFDAWLNGSVDLPAIDGGVSRFVMSDFGPGAWSVQTRDRQESAGCVARLFGGHTRAASANGGMEALAAVSPPNASRDLDALERVSE